MLGWGSGWTLGGSSRLLGVTGSDLSEPEGAGKRLESRGWDEVGCAGKRLGGP